MITAYEILIDLLSRIGPEAAESFLCFAIGGPPCRCPYTHAGACR